MIIDLSSIANNDGKKIGININIDYQAEDLGFAFAEPVKVTGNIVNMGGELELSAIASAKLKLACDRCCEEFEQFFECPVEEVLKKEDALLKDDENPDAIYFQGNSIEIDDIVLNSIITALPLKQLCQDDCKGLCQNCGANLNHTTCNCDTRTQDPRFDALDKLL